MKIKPISFSGSSTALWEKYNLCSLVWDKNALNSTLNPSTWNKLVNEQTNAMLTKHKWNYELYNKSLHQNHQVWYWTQMCNCLCHWMLSNLKKKIHTLHLWKVKGSEDSSEPPKLWTTLYGSKDWGPHVWVAWDTPIFQEVTATWYTLAWSKNQNRNHKC